MSNEVQSVGRINYIEPNDIYNKDNNNKTIENGIPHPYEDYCVSVDLRVEVPDRESCGAAGNSGSEKIYEYSSDKNTISFIGGTDGFLTTNFTDIQSINTSKSTNECLGIESITIKHNSWFAPQVTIKFVDVRGASLMGKQEDAYVDTLRSDIQAGVSGNTKINGGSFFKSLFSFPYPIFKLKVKGFYGKEVTYNLSVEKFNADFDSNTGNFNITVDFIGYMYGIYTDIPMNFMVISPYVEGVGDEYWDSKVKNGGFRYLGSNKEILKYSKLKSEIAKIGRSVDEDIKNSEEERKKNKLEDKLNALKDIKAYINDNLINIFDISYYYPQLFNTGNVKERILVGISKTYQIVSTTGRVSEDIKNSIKGEIYNATGFLDELKTKISNYNINCDSEDDKLSKEIDNLGLDVPGLRFLVSTSGFTDDIIQDENKNEWDLGTFLNTRSELVNDWINKAITGDCRVNATEQTYNFYGDGKTITSWIKERCVRETLSPSTPVYCFISPAWTIPEWIGDIDSKLSKLDNELTLQKNKLEKVRIDSINNAMGFNLTIGNAFRMAFAHMDTFMYVFHYYLKQIYTKKGDGTRSLSSLGIDINNTDLASNFGRTRNVPPFTMFYRETEESSNTENQRGGKKKEPIWIGELKGFENFPEIDFVNRLIDASKNYAHNEVLNEKIADATENNLRTGEDKTETFIPLTNFDITHMDNKNPYCYLKDINKSGKQAEAMFTTLLLRVMYWYLTNPHNTGTIGSKQLAYVGEIEAYNFLTANPEIIPDIKEYLSKFKDKESAVDAIINFGLNNNTNDSVFYNLKQGVFNNHLIVSKGNNVSYDWMKKEGELYYPISNINPEYIDVDAAPSEGCVNIDNVTSNTVSSYLLDTTYNVKSDKSNVLVELEGALSRLGKEVQEGYKENITKEYKLREFRVGTSNNVNTKSEAAEVCIVNSSNLLTKADGGVTFPKEKENKNSSSYYIYIPSFVKIDEDGSYPTYGYPLMYKNKGMEMVQAFLFAMGLPIKGITVEGIEDTENYSIPRLRALWEGALWYRYYKESELSLSILDGYKVPASDEVFISDSSTESYRSLTFTLIPKISTQNYLSIDVFKAQRPIESQRIALMNYFENWAQNTFPTLHSYFILRNAEGNEYSEDGLNNLIKYCSEHYSKDGWKFRNTFLGNRGTSTAFYDADGVFKLKNKKALLVEPKKESDLQSGLLDFYSGYYILINTDNVQDKQRAISKNLLSQAIGSFYEKISKEYDKMEAKEESNEESRREVYDPDNDVNVKIATYMTLKNLYDKWICANKNVNKWSLLDDDSEGVSEFSNFRFIDGFYRRMENRLIVNFENIAETIEQVMAGADINDTSGNGKYFGLSMWDAMTSICEKNHVLFMAFPMENEFTNPKGIKEMFEAYPYSQMDSRDTSCFVCVYTNEPSKHLEIDPETCGYASDGFNVANAYGKVLETELIPQLFDTDSDNYQIPCFAVTYAKQNQSYFTNVSVGMQNPQMTEASIAATQVIASKGELGANETTLYGQDLYRIYSNYSYTCTVEMLGDAQIMPLTYFQLNNIPLFRGVYMIISVEHDISAGKMTTKFTGVRMSKYDTPKAGDDYSVLDIVGDNGNSSENNDIANSIRMDEITNMIMGTSTRKFTIEYGQLCFLGDTAKTYNKNHPECPVENVPTAEEDKHIRELAQRLQILQDAWVGHCEANSDEKWSKYCKLHMTCGYRCGKTNDLGDSVNSLVGGSSTSAHRLGYAADIQLTTEDGKGYNSTFAIDELFKFTVLYSRQNNLPWDQIIWEHNDSKGTKWMHYGLKNNGGKQRGQLLVYHSNGNPKYQSVTI